MDKVRLGIIGIGSMGSFHVKYIAEGHVKNAQLTAVCDIDKNRLENMHDGIALFNDAQELIKSGTVDAVIISTPHYMHPVIAQTAFKNGVHVLTEKPAGVCIKQVIEMNETAEKSGLVFGIMFNQRTNPVYARMRELIQLGEIGEIQRTNWIITDWYRTQEYYESSSWRATYAGEGGGVLMNQAVHNLDLWQWICGMPDKVTAFCHFGKYHNIEVEDDVTAYVEYPNGATGVFITTTGDNPGANRFEVTGDKGKLLVENNRLHLWKLDRSVKEFSRDASLKGSPKSEYSEIKVDAPYYGHAGITNNFVETILTSNGSPRGMIAHGSDGLNSVLLINAMYMSSWTNRLIDINKDMNPDNVWAEFEKRIETSRGEKTAASYREIWKPYDNALTK